MNKKIIIAFLLTLFASGIADTARAGYPKKKKAKKHAVQQTQANSETSEDFEYKEKKISREEKKKKRLERKRLKKERKEQMRLEKEAEKIKKKSAGQAVKDFAPFKYPATTFKSKYQLHILASLYLDELVQKKSVTFKNKVPDKALPGISFYEGVSIAADSLKKAGFDIDIFVHDITSTAESLDSLFFKNTLDSADLIIGAIQTADIPRVADFAKAHKINFVSALSPSDAGVKNNKYFTLLQPSLRSHCQRISGDITNKFPGMKVSLIYRTSSEADENAYRYITENEKVKYTPLLCTFVPNRRDLLTIFDSTKPNIVVVPVLDRAFADSLLKAISKNFGAVQFEVYGMPSWSALNNLRKEEVFPNLSVNVTTSLNLDMNTPVTKYLAATYKNLYGGKPSESVYLGFETVMWYASLLKTYGTMFNSGYNDNSAAPFTKFEVMQLRDKEGHIIYSENKRIMLSRYEEGTMKTQ